MPALTTQTAKAQVRQTSDNFLLVTELPVASGGLFPGQIVYGAGGLLDVVNPPIGIQSQVRRCRGFRTIRVGVTSTVGGTLRVLEAWTPGVAQVGAIMLNWAQTFAAPTIADPVSGLQVMDAFVENTREFVVIRFDAFNPLAGIFQIGAYLLPV